jgi:hypothetical protein
VTQARPFTTTKPPPIESLARAYWTPLMSPLPVVTRLPQPAPSEDTVSQFLRVESGGGAQLVNAGQEGYFWRVSVLLHSYAPDEFEAAAEESLSTALGWGANAQGTYITTIKSQQRWYVSVSSAPVLGTKIEDPRVALTRYRGLVSWSVVGHPL